jgi:large subunit ribosomal protein L15
MIRRRKKSRKRRGRERRLGGKRRGAGSRGGRGRAGVGKRGKQKKLSFLREPKRKGFKRHPSLISRVKSINVGELDELIPKLLELRIAEEREGKVEIDLAKLGIQKLLGSGKVSRALRVKARFFSREAKRKIEQAGGEVTGH